MDWIAVYGRRHIQSRQVMGVWVDVGDGERIAVPQPLHADGREHSEGFEWGYAGQGPQALAHALIALSIGAYTFRHGMDGLTLNLVSPKGVSEICRMRGYRPPYLVRDVISKLPTGGGWRFSRRELTALVGQTFDARTVRG